jgi:adenosylmethionine-8-amino-7-oxononanoate aminotransferase
VLVLADEIAVGLGRTGKIFAHAWHGEVPDLLCVGKALSGGALPLSAVLVARELEAAFRGPVANAFAHSHTFCGNPIATAAGVASIGLLERHFAGTAVDDAIAALDGARQRVAAACPAVVASRQAGCIVAFDLVPVTRRPADGRVGLALRTAALRHGVLLRPLGDTLYWMPPLLLDAEALACLEHATVAAIHEVLG